MRSKADQLARYALAFRLRREGKTFREIGEVLGVGSSAARQVVMREEHRQEREGERIRRSRRGGIMTLSTRLYNCLHAAGFSDDAKPDEVAKEIDRFRGAAKWHRDKYRGDMRNFGPKVLAELEAWLVKQGALAPALAGKHVCVKTSNIWRFCPWCGAPLRSQ